MDVTLFTQKKNPKMEDDDTVLLVKKNMTNGK